MHADRAKDLLMNLLERAMSGERTFMTSREVEALKSILLDKEGETNVEIVRVTPPSTPHASRAAIVKSYRLALDLGSVENEDTNAIVCVDFGTSFSKAFASVTEAGLTRYVDLPIGDGSSGTRLTTPSELLVSDSEIFFGSKARQRVEDTQTSTETIIDSIKQFITLGKEVSKLGSARLPTIQDKNGSLTQRDVLVLYLAHLMHLTETALVDAGLSKNLSRRFAHPAWKDHSKNENATAMRRLMAEAIVLARSVGSDLANSMELSSAVTLLEQLRTLSEELLPISLIGEPVREATAAGAGALLSTPENTRQAYLIVDVGAGTTDVAGFLCVNNPNWDKARVFEITTAATAMNKAGNMLDQILHKHILDKSSLVQDTTEYRSASLDIRRQRRALKEQLFTEGRLVVLLPTDEVVEIDLSTFLDQPQIRDFAKTLHDLVAQSAAIVAGTASRINFVATGGGSSLPFVRKLAEDGVQFDKRHINLDLIDAMPVSLAQTNPELSGAFPQVAVAFGGSLPDLPEQRSSVPTGIEQAPKRVIAPIYKS